MSAQIISAYREKLIALNCCIIIPTYNNQQTLADVINEVLLYTPHLIVVNDGSTDDTTAILSNFPAVHVIAYSPNRGKGIALRQGIAYAQEKGYRYAITMD